MCEQKKREENDKWEKEAEQVRSERDVWEIMNRGRRKRKRVNENIEEKEWRLFYEITGRGRAQSGGRKQEQEW